MRDDETNHFTGRLKRYTSVSSQMVGLGVRLVSARVLKDKQPNDVAEDVRAVLGSLKGPLMKVAQLLASVPDLLPAKYAQELMQLQADAPEMGESFVKRRMRSELGEKWQTLFQDFPLKASAAASLGQVHKAICRTGETVACKLQYPNMASAIEADIKQLKILMGVLETYNRAIDSSEIRQEVADRLREELDYKQESKHIKLFNYIFKDCPEIKIPYVYDDLSTRRLLTMSWLPGHKIMDARTWSQDRRNRIAENIFRAWYRPFYKFGVLHGDPHLGNYTVTEDGKMNVLDFGCVRKFEPKFIKGVISLYYALRDQNLNLAREAYQCWGFQDLSPELITVLNGWAEYIYAPLLDNRVRAIDDQNTSLNGQNIAFKVHEDLKRLGGVRPPRAFVFMNRAAVGLGSVFMHLKAQVNWHKLFHDLIDDFSEDRLTQNQNRALQAANLSPPAT